MNMTEFNQHDLLNLFDNQLHQKERYLYPQDGNESVESAVARRFTKLREDSGSITLVDGAFDVPHNNHEWYLRHYKMIGAYATLKAIRGSSVTLDDFEAHISSDAAVLNRYKLAVTVDADEKIALKKSGLPTKGGVERPIYPWQARADRLAGYHFHYAHGLHQTVDLVTVEGDSLHQGTPLESSLALAAFLKSEDLLDNFIVYGEHDATAEQADALSLSPIIIADGVPYEANPQTGMGWSSSQIIRRAQGHSVAFPVTRPERTLAAVGVNHDRL